MIEGEFSLENEPERTYLLRSEVLGITKGWGAKVLFLIEKERWVRKAKKKISEKKFCEKWVRGWKI